MSTTQSDTNSQDADSADVPYPLLLLQTTLAALLFVLVLGGTAHDKCDLRQWVTDAVIYFGHSQLFSVSLHLPRRHPI